MKLRRMLSCMMALLLAASLPVSVLAEEYDLAKGSITVSATKDGMYVTQADNDIINHKEESDTVITQTGSETSTTNTVIITAEENATANVTLDGVNIDTSSTGEAAVEIMGDGNVVIELDGNNTVQGGYHHAGVEKNNSGSLTITDNNGNGSLKATGGTGGAGIGGGAYSDGSNITISGGTVNATGGENASGIGGGVKSDGFDGGNGSNITISGGTVTATGGMGSAGIGGASGGTGSNITISDGNVTANGGEGGSGMGGGAYGGGSGIAISGGTVAANGGTDAAGIGGGERANGSDITISGGITTAIGGDAPRNDDGGAGQGGGAGIGGGAYGSGDNIAIKGNAQVTAEGKGNAANIGNGNSEKDTEKQKDKVDLSGLSSFGKVNGVSGSNEVPGSNGDSGSNDDSGSNGDSGSNEDSGSSGDSGSNEVPGNNGDSGSSDGGDSKLQTSVSIGNPGIGGSSKSWTDAAADIGVLRVSDNDGNDLSNVVWLKGDSELEITAKEDKVSVIGNKADLLQLTVEGVNKINLETNRVNVSVSNEVLNKITGTGGSFQLRTDDTTVNLTATDQNNKTTLDMTLTANKQSGTQAAPGQSSKQPVTISIDSQNNTGNNSKGGTLQLKTNASDATLTYSDKCAQALLDSNFRNLALAVGNVTSAVDTLLAMNTTVNGSGSISIRDESVIMNGFHFSAGDSSENDKLTDLVNNIKFKMENSSQSGSMMVAEVDAKAALESASLAVTGSTLRSLIEQNVEETVLSVNGKTTGFKNSAMRKYFDDSQMGSAAVINVKHLPNGETESWVDKVDEHGNVIVQVDSL